MSMEPPIPLACHVCAAVATPAAPIRACSRCGVHAYCSREHQMQDWPSHKLFCDCLLKLTDMAARGERHLRDAPRGTVYDGKLFDEAVGYFSMTRPSTEIFMRTKYAIVHTLAILRKSNEKTAKRALPEALDCLRLCRKDDHGVRDVIPSFMLQLGQLQECYDFIKWCAACDDNGAYDWSDPEKPFRGVHNADMTEPIAALENIRSPFFLSALTFIKMALADMLEDALASLDGQDTALDGNMLENQLVSAGLGAALDLPLRELTKLHMLLAQQANEAFWLTHACDPDYWTAMLDPTAIVRNFLGNTAGLELSDGGRAALPAWVANNAAVWYHRREFIHALLAMV